MKRQLSLDSPTQQSSNSNNNSNNNLNPSSSSSFNSKFKRPPMLRRNTEKDFISNNRKKSILINNNFNFNNSHNNNNNSHNNNSYNNNNNNEENFLSSFGYRNILNKEVKNNSNESNIVLSPMAISRCICVLIQKLMISSQQIEVKSVDTQIEGLSSAFPSVSVPGQFTPDTYVVFSRNYISKKQKKFIEETKTSVNIDYNEKQNNSLNDSLPVNTSRDLLASQQVDNYDENKDESPQLTSSNIAPKTSNSPILHSIVSFQSKDDPSCESITGSSNGVRFFSRSGSWKTKSKGSFPTLSRSPSRIKGLLYPSKSQTQTVKIVALPVLTQYFSTICVESQMEYECAVISLIYLTRMISYSNGIFHLTELNYRGVILACMILATKVWDDFGMINSSYTEIFPGLTIERINELELQLLYVLRFDLWITIKEFTFYHFMIQELITKDELKKYQKENSLINPSTQLVDGMLLSPDRRKVVTHQGILSNESKRSNYNTNDSNSNNNSNNNSKNNSQNNLCSNGVFDENIIVSQETHTFQANHPKFSPQQLESSHKLNNQSPSIQLQSKPQLGGQTERLQQLQQLQKQQRKVVEEKELSLNNTTNNNNENNNNNNSDTIVNNLPNTMNEWSMKLKNLPHSPPSSITSSSRLRRRTERPRRSENSNQSDQSHHSNHTNTQINKQYESVGYGTEVNGTIYEENMEIEGQSKDEYQNDIYRPTTPAYNNNIEDGYDRMVSSRHSLSPRLLSNALAAIKSPNSTSEDIIPIAFQDSKSEKYPPVHKFNCYTPPEQQHEQEQLLKELGAESVCSNEDIDDYGSGYDSQSERRTSDSNWTIYTSANDRDSHERFVGKGIGRIPLKKHLSNQFDENIENEKSDRSNKNDKNDRDDRIIQQTQQQQLAYRSLTSTPVPALNSDLSNLEQTLEYHPNTLISNMLAIPDHVVSPSNNCCWGFKFWFYPKTNIVHVIEEPVEQQIPHRRSHNERRNPKYPNWLPNWFKPKKEHRTTNISNYQLHSQRSSVHPDTNSNSGVEI